MPGPTQPQVPTNPSSTSLCHQGWQQIDKVRQEGEHGDVGVRRVQVARQVPPPSGQYHYAVTNLEGTQGKDPRKEGDVSFVDNQPVRKGNPGQ